MPKIFEYFGYVFFFYSNEHEPIHVHVENGELKSVVRRNAKGYLPLSQHDIKITDEFIKVYALEIVQKWIDYFVMKKSVQCTQIKKRL